MRAPHKSHGNSPQHDFGKRWFEKPVKVLPCFFKVALTVLLRSVQPTRAFDEITQLIDNFLVRWFGLQGLPEMTALFERQQRKSFRNWVCDLALGQILAAIL